MCGAGTFATDWTNMAPSSSRRLMRNASSNSCHLNNNGGAGASASAINTPVAVKNDVAAEGDRLCQAATSSGTWDTASVSLADGMACGGSATCCTTTSSTVSLRTSFDGASYDSLRPHLQHQGQTPEAAAVMQADPQQLLLGTSSGLFQLDLASGQVHQLGLASVPVAFVCYNSCGLVLAACPVQDAALFGSAQSMAAAKDAAGLYCLNLGRQQPACAAPSSEGFIACSSSGVPAMKLWQGGATCCAFAPSSDDEQVVPRIYLGTQPADLIYSDDLGGSWSSSELSEAPQADNWFRRLPPYDPSVRSINFCGSRSTAQQATAAAAAGEPQTAPIDLLVAVEVGGVLSSPQQSPEQDSSSWTDCSQALCRDVHALQADPFNPNCLYAVAGSGHLPGGLYRCKGKGQKWKRLFGYRYSVGMALSAYQKGRMLLVSADKPPATGCILFESVDSGRTWVNISDDVADAVAALTDHAPEVLETAPLTTFVPGGLVVSCASGHVFHGIAKPLGGYSSWKLLTVLPAAVNCMCGTHPAAAPVSIQRS